METHPAPARRPVQEGDAMLDRWIEENMYGILIAIEIMWVAGFGAVIVAYFAVKWHFAKARKAKILAEKAGHEPEDPAQPG